MLALAGHSAHAGRSMASSVTSGRQSSSSLRLFTLRINCVAQLIPATGISQWAKTVVAMLHAHARQPYHHLRFQLTSFSQTMLPAVIDSV